MEKKNKVGRPLLFATPEELKQKVDEYFAWCDERKAYKTDKNGEKLEVPWPRPYTLSGLAEFLDCDRKTLLNYSERDQFFPTITRARRKCEQFAEEQLFDGNDRGSKFSLINNYGWSDKQELAHYGKDGEPAIRIETLTEEELRRKVEELRRELGR